MSIQLEINQVINSLTESEKNMEGLRKLLATRYPKSIMRIKDSSNDLFMIVNEYSSHANSNLSTLEKEARSLILDKKTLQVVCYTHDNILYNQEAKSYLLKIASQSDKYETQITECFEGTLVSVYHYHGEWHISTRKCLNAYSSNWINDKSHGEMFVEAVGGNFVKFCSHLNPEFCYFFVLVHHNNKHIIDYSKYFGNEKYQEIIHIMTRRQDTQQEVPMDDKSLFLDDFSIRQPKVLDNYDMIEENNKLFSKLEKGSKKSSVPLTMEGIVIRARNVETGKTEILKIQTNAYQLISSLIPNSNNKYKSFVELYQNDRLKTHLEYFPENAKIDNPRYHENPYDTLGVVSATFKVMTSELFELFHLTWDVKNNQKHNEDLYYILSPEYTTALYRIKEIYFSKKAEYIKLRNEGKEVNPKAYYVKIADIYNLLKNYHSRELIDLFHARKKMKNESDKYMKSLEGDSVYKKFRTISNKCDRIPLKMAAIFLNKMFPDKEDDESTDDEREIKIEINDLLD